MEICWICTALQFHQNQHVSIGCCNLNELSLRQKNWHFVTGCSARKPSSSYKDLCVLIFSSFESCVDLNISTKRERAKI